MKHKAFTLIELLVVIAILAILTAITISIYKGYTASAKCTSFSEQHRKVVNAAEETFAFCRLNNSTYLNTGPTSSAKFCRGQSWGVTAIGLQGNKCVRKWNCKINGVTPNAGSMDVAMMYHIRAEFNQPGHTGGFVRNDQWQNFEKSGYPSRPGLTNIRDNGALLRISTYLGESCKGGDYKIDEVKWP